MRLESEAMNKKQSFVFGVLFSALLLTGISTSFRSESSIGNQSPETQQLAFLGPGDDGPKAKLT
jgi:hypothetical protein